MLPEYLIVAGIVVAGHRVASQPSKDYPYPALEKQKPFFKERGLDLAAFHPATLNISIAPWRFEMVNPRFIFPLVPWTDLHPPETFSFSPCKVTFQETEHAGMVYYPHPETKIRHFQDPCLIEVITEYIPGIAYGAHVCLGLDPEEIKLKE
jgi:hypothetical protein